MRQVKEIAEWFAEVAEVAEFAVGGQGPRTQPVTGTLSALSHTRCLKRQPVARISAERRMRSLQSQLLPVALL